jgi:hypothetical protein
MSISPQQFQCQALADVLVLESTTALFDFGSGFELATVRAELQRH